MGQGVGFRVLRVLRFRVQGPNFSSRREAAPLAWGQGWQDAMVESRQIC